MIRHTQAYVTWRSQSQDMLDFAVMVCTAAPQLRHALKEHDADPKAFVAANSTFRPSNVPHSTEKRALSTYKKVLGANLHLAIFSYFETYFFSMIDEVVEFHGGPDALEKIVRKQIFQRAPSKNQREELKGLRTTYKANRADRYRKFTSAIDSGEVVWPSQRLMLYGLKQLVAQKKRWRSADIPSLLETLLLFDMTEDEAQKFHTFRDTRNKIAHGKRLSYDIKKALDTSNFLRELAIRIDSHVVDYFLIIERYAH